MTFPVPGVQKKRDREGNRRRVDQPGDDEAFTPPHHLPSLTCTWPTVVGKNHFRMVPALSLADIVKDNG